MIEINLLPEDLRHKKDTSFDLNIQTEKFRVFALGGISAALVVIAIFLATFLSIRKYQIACLTVNEKKISSRIAEIESLNKEVSMLKGRISGLDGIIRRKFLWAKKLNQLSDLILPGTWFTRIYVDQENRLVIEGSVISQTEEEMASVGKLMKNIKEDADFFKDFQNIKLESVQRSNREEKDIVDFKIVLYL